MGLAYQTLTSVVLLTPDALDGGGLRTTAAEALVPVVQLLVAVFGLRLRRHPIDACGTRLARLLGRLPPKVWITQVREGRQAPLWIVGGLRRQALECGCDHG